MSVMRPTFTAWITKYALTTGIEKMRVEHCIAISASMVSAKGQCFHGEGEDWHRTEEGAIKRAEKMRVDKIASLRKQIAKLEKMKLSS